MIELGETFTVEVFKSEESVIIRTQDYNANTTIDSQFSHEHFAQYVEYLASHVPG